MKQQINVTNLRPLDVADAWNNRIFETKEAQIEDNVNKSSAVVDILKGLKRLKLGNITINLKHQVIEIISETKPSFGISDFYTIGGNNEQDLASTNVKKLIAQSSKTYINDGERIVLICKDKGKQTHRSTEDFFFIGFEFLERIEMDSIIKCIRENILTTADFNISIHDLANHKDYELHTYETKISKEVVLPIQDDLDIQTVKVTIGQSDIGGVFCRGVKVYNYIPYIVDIDADQIADEEILFAQVLNLILNNDVEIGSQDLKADWASRALMHAKDYLLKDTKLAIIKRICGDNFLLSSANSEYNHIAENDGKKIIPQSILATHMANLFTDTSLSVDEYVDAKRELQEKTIVECSEYQNIKNLIKFLAKNLIGKVVDVKFASIEQRDYTTVDTVIIEDDVIFINKNALANNPYELVLESLARFLKPASEFDYMQSLIKLSGQIVDFIVNKNNFLEMITGCPATDIDNKIDLAVQFLGSPKLADVAKTPEFTVVEEEVALVAPVVPVAPVVEKVEEKPDPQFDIEMIEPEPEPAPKPEVKPKKKKRVRTRKRKVPTKSKGKGKKKMPEEAPVGSAGLVKYYSQQKSLRVPSGVAKKLGVSPKPTMATLYNKNNYLHIQFPHLHLRAKLNDKWMLERQNVPEKIEVEVKQVSDIGIYIPIRVHYGGYLVPIEEDPDFISVEKI